MSNSVVLLWEFRIFFTIIPALDSVNVEKIRTSHAHAHAHAHTAIDKLNCQTNKTVGKKKGSFSPSDHGYVPDGCSEEWTTNFQL